MKDPVTMATSNASFAAHLEDARKLVATFYSALFHRAIELAVAGPWRGLERIGECELDVNLDDLVESPEPAVQILGVLATQTLAAKVRLEGLATEATQTEPGLPPVFRPPSEPPERENTIAGEHDRDLLEGLATFGGLSGFLEHSALAGEGPRPVRMVAVEQLDLRSTKESQRIAIVGRAIGTDGRERRVSVEAWQDRDVEPFAPMMGGYRWLAESEAGMN